MRPSSQWCNANPRVLFDELFQHGACWDTALKGFSIIAGDLSVDITSHPNWVRLQGLGSQDMAVLSGRTHGIALDNTCLDARRNSFILVNAHAVHALTACQTTD